MSAAPRSAGSEPPDTLSRVGVGQMIAAYAVLALVAWAGWRWLAPENAPELLLATDGPPLAIVALAAAVAAVLLTGISEISTRFFESARRLKERLEQILGGLRRRDALALAAASSIGEELLFRGVLLPIVGLIPSALLFGIAHVGPKGARIWWMVWATVGGLCFGWLTLWSGALYAAIMAHFLVNAYSLTRLSSASTA